MCQGLLRELICRAGSVSSIPRGLQGKLANFIRGPEDAVGNNILRPEVLTEKIFAILLPEKSSGTHGLSLPLMHLEWLKIQKYKDGQGLPYPSYS